MKKIIILDTNVLLDDPRAFLTFKKNDIIIPYKVIEELEKHKTSQGEVGMNARDCSRIISGILKEQTSSTLKSGVKLETGVKLFVISSIEFKETISPIETGDDHILAVCVGVKKEWKSYSPVLVSNDMLLRIRANSFGIKCETYNSNTVINNKDDLYSGYKIIEASEDVIARYWEENKGVTFGNGPKEITKEKLFLNDFIILSDNGNDLKKKPYPILRVKEHNKKKELCFVNEYKFNNKIKCQNIEQVMAVDLLMDPTVKLVTLTGIAGSGKTLISLASGLEQIIDKKLYKQFIVVRPTHSVGKEMGYLPGPLEEKLEPWMKPIKDNLKIIYGKENADYLINNNTIEFESLSLIRGRSITNAFVYIDEAQNTDVHEIKTILTRIGNGSKVVIGGDVEQIDRKDVDSISNGLSIVIEKFKEYGVAGHVSLKDSLRGEIASIAAKIL